MPMCSHYNNNFHQSNIIIVMHGSYRMYTFIFYNASILFRVNVMLQKHQFGFEWEERGSKFVVENDVESEAQTVTWWSSD